MIIANIEEALKSSKGDPSTVSSARTRIIGNLNHNPNQNYCQIEEALKADPSTVSSARSRIIGTLNKPIDITPTFLPIIANIEEALKSSKGDPSTVSSARSRIIGTLNKLIRHNPNLSPDYCQHRRRRQSLKSSKGESTVSSARSRIIGNLNKGDPSTVSLCKISYHWDFEQTN